MDGPGHTGHDVVPTEQAEDFRLDVHPGAPAEPAQELAIKARVQSQTLGDREDHLPVRDGKQTSSATCRAVSKVRFWWQEGAGAALLAGKGDKHLVLAARAASSALPMKGRTGAPTVPNRRCVTRRLWRKSSSVVDTRKEAASPSGCSAWWPSVGSRSGTLPTSSQPTLPVQLEALRLSGNHLSKRVAQADEFAWSSRRHAPRFGRSSEF